MLALFGFGKTHIQTFPNERWFLFHTNLLGHYSSFRGPFRILPARGPFRELPGHMCFIVCFRKPSAGHGLQVLLPRALAQKQMSF